MTADVTEDIEANINKCIYFVLDSVCRRSTSAVFQSASSSSDYFPGDIPSVQL